MAGNLATTGLGTFTHTPGGTGTVTMSGASKTISGTGLTFSKLSVSGSTTNTASFTVYDDLTVGGSLTASGGIITLSGTGKTIAGAGTLTFSGVSVPGGITKARGFSITSDFNVSGSFTASAGVVTFAGTTTFSGKANLYDTTLNGTRLRLGAGSALRLAGTTTLTAGTFDATNQMPNTVVFNGASTQSAYPITYCNLEIAAGGAKNAAGNLAAYGNFTINASAVFNGGTGNYTNYVQGNRQNLVTFNAGNSAVELTGPNDAFLLGPSTFNRLRVNKDAASVMVNFVSNNVTVATLDMVLGTMQTGTNVLTLTSTRTGYGVVFGTLTRTHAFMDNVPYAFESPSNFIMFASGASGVSSISVNVQATTVSGFPYGAAINRLYPNSITAGSAYSATLRLHYQDSELNGNSELWRKDGSTWTPAGRSANDATANWVETDTLASISGEWTLAEFPNVAEWNGSVSTAWENAANWSRGLGSPALPPGATDVALLSRAGFVHQPWVSSAVAVRSVEFSGSQPVTLTVGTGGSLTVAGNVAGNWSGNATHTLNVGNLNL